MSRDSWHNRSDRLLRAGLAQKHNRRKTCAIGIAGSVRGSVGKRSYSSKGQAERAAKEMGEQFGQKLNVYRCRCGAWHTTTQEQIIR